MRKIVALCALALALFGAIEWRDDFDAAYEQAKRSGKPLFVFIERHDPPCRWCEKMKKTTLADPEVAEYINTRYTPVRLVRESGDYPPELRPRYVPTIYVIDGNKVVGQITGYWEPREFWSDLKDIERKLGQK